WSTILSSSGLHADTGRRKAKEILRRKDPSEVLGCKEWGEAAGTFVEAFQIKGRVLIRQSRVPGFGQAGVIKGRHRGSSTSNIVRHAVSFAHRPARFSCTREAPPSPLGL